MVAPGASQSALYGGGAGKNDGPGSRPCPLRGRQSNRVSRRLKWPPGRSRRPDADGSARSRRRLDDRVGFLLKGREILRPSVPPAGMHANAVEHAGAATSTPGGFDVAAILIVGCPWSRCDPVVTGMHLRAQLSSRGDGIVAENIVTSGTTAKPGENYAPSMKCA
jgi:hypothetical protein